MKFQPHGAYKHRLFYAGSTECHSQFYVMQYLNSIFLFLFFYDI